MTRPQPRSAPPSFEDLTVAFEQGMKAGDDSEYGRLASAFDWESAPCEQWLRGADMAISMSLLHRARRLVSEGLTRWPEEPGFARLWKIVRPPDVRTTPPSAQGPEIDASRAWLSTEGRQYAGQWVAVQNGRLLAASPSLRQLREALGSLQIPGVLVTMALG